MFGVMFLLTQYLQLVLGFSPFDAGLLMLPMPMIMMARRTAVTSARPALRHHAAWCRSA